MHQQGIRMEGMSDLNALNLEPGEVVGGYTLISRLGSGAMGSVWRVRDDGGTTYAMKILRDSLTDESVAGSGSASTALHDPDLKPDVTPRERLRREAMALKKINHPGVCGIVDMELDDTLAFIVTELIEGKNLKDDVAANGRYVGDDLERLARKLIEATKAVHAAGIVHRDIKPTNVMVSAAGPVLVDFGIAMGEGESHVTRTGLVMGTPGFIAPEIIDGAESDDATDWWSVASVLAFAATGAPVFGTKPMMAVLEREASGNANLSGLPAGTLAAFRSALDPDRRDRCTPDQLLNAIALDALNPNAWQGEQAGPFAAGAVAGQPAAIVAEAAEAMPPFGAAGGVDRNNPRTIWRAAEEAAEAPTMAVFSGNKGDNGDGETVVFSPAGAATATLPLADMPPRPPAGATVARRCCRFHRRRRHAGTHRRDHTDAGPNHAAGRAHHRTPHAAAVIIPPVRHRPEQLGSRKQPAHSGGPRHSPGIAAHHRPNRPSGPHRNHGPKSSHAQSGGREARGISAARHPAIDPAGGAAGGTGGKCSARGHHRGHCVVVATAHPGL